MITQFFSNTKPTSFITIISISVLTIFFYTFVINNNFTQASQIPFFLLSLLFFVIYLYSVRIFCKRNEIFENTYFVVLFTFLISSLFPSIYTNIKLLIVSVLLHFSISNLTFPNNFQIPKYQLFNSSFAIVLASFLFNWTILFLIVPILISLIYSKTKVSDFFIPLVAVLSVFVFYATYLIASNDFEISNIFNFYVDINIVSYYHMPLFFSIILFFCLVIFSFLLNISSSVKIKEHHLITVYIYDAVCCIIIFLSPIKDGSEFIFLLLPLSISLTETINKIEKQKFKDIFLCFIIFVCLVLHPVIDYIY